MTSRHVLVVLALTWCPVAAAAISSIVLLSAAAAQGRRALSPAAGLIGDLLSTAAPWRQQPLSPLAYHQAHTSAFPRAAANGTTMTSRYVLVVYFAI